MFAAWGHLVVTHRRLVAALSAVSLLVALVAIVAAGANLDSEGFVSNSAESARVDQTLATQFGRGSDSLVFLFDTPRPVSDPATRQAVEAALQPLTGDRRFSRVLTTWSTGNANMIDRTNHATYAVATISPNADPSDAELQQIIDDVSAHAKANGLTVTTGGGTAVGIAASDGVREGIVRAESVSVPLTLLVAVVVFGSLVAAGLPFLISIFAIVAAIAAVFALSHSGFQSIFAINVITMLGLGLGIDYSLFMVTRFREEIARRPTDEALAVTMATVGKAILFSGITVIFGLAATQFFPLPAVHSIGQAGMIVTGLALIYGLTLLPALLALLGPRVNRFSLGRHQQAAAEGGFWHAIARTVMRYPVPVLVGLVAVLLVTGLPFRRLDITPGGPEVLPPSSGPYQVSQRLAADFPHSDAEPISVIVTMADGGSPTAAANLARVRDFANSLAALPDVSGVEPWQTPATVRGDMALLQVTTNATGATAEQIVRDIRDLNPAGMSVQVGGHAAQAVDTVDGIRAGMLPAALFVLIGAYLILLLAFGSVILPLKAIFMTLLSISASLGALVLVFQDGRLEGLFGFQASGQIISVTPIFMFCFLFGLSMDYEVLLLSRIQEEYERTGDNTAAVAHGMAQTGRIITGAAAIMIIAFGGFMLADIVIIKSLGFGLSLAVLIDATLVRGLLVPATMRLLGRWNWWAPPSIRRVVDRLGLNHRPALPEASGAD